MEERRAAILLVALCAVLVAAGLGALCADRPVEEVSIFDDPRAADVEIPPEAPARGLPELSVDLGGELSVRNPPEEGPRAWIHVTNRSREHLTVIFSIYAVETRQRIPGWPQPNMLYLAPGETQGIFTFLDILWGRLGDLPIGTGTRTIRYDLAIVERNAAPPQGVPRVFIPRADIIVPQASYRKRCIIVKTPPEKMACAFTVEGTVRCRKTAKPLPGAHVMALTGNNGRLQAKADERGRYAVAIPHGLPITIRAYARGFRNAFSVAKGDAGARRKLDFTLAARKESADFEIEDYRLITPGFWRGAYCPAKDRILLAHGMEHWSDPSQKESSLLVCVDGRGREQWRRSLGQEAWGVDISADGRRAAAVTLPGEGMTTPSELSLLDARAGTPVFTRGVSSLHGSRPMESREVALSPRGDVLAVGTAMGTLLLLETGEGKARWSAFCRGQVRRLLFDRAGSSLYAGCGDGFLYRFDAATGRRRWRAFVKGWAFMEGLALSPDERLAAAGTKTGYVAVVDAATGALRWTCDMRGPVHYVRFSPRGDLLLAGSVGEGGTRVFEAATGRLLWQAGFSTSGAWAPSGRWLAIAKRIVAVYDPSGTLMAVPTGLHGRATALFATSDERIVLATDRGELCALKGAVRPYAPGRDEWNYP